MNRDNRDGSAYRAVAIHSFLCGWCNNGTYTDYTTKGSGWLAMPFFACGLHMFGTSAQLVSVYNYMDRRSYFKPILEHV